MAKFSIVENTVFFLQASENFLIWLPPIEITLKSKYN